MNAGMTGRKPSDGGPSTREQRLAEALRANLRRRKAASRVRPEGGTEGGAAPEPADMPGKSKPSGRRP